jgi:hypothetical protein
MRFLPTSIHAGLDYVLGVVLAIFRHWPSPQAKASDYRQRGSGEEGSGSLNDSGGEGAVHGHLLTRSRALLHSKGDRPPAHATVQFIPPFPQLNEMGWFWRIRLAARTTAADFTVGSDAWGQRHSHVIASDLNVI